jgi:hypothetical protein
VASAAPAVPTGDFRVNVSQVGEHTGPSVAVFPDGGFVVVWTAGPKDGHKVVHARLFSKNGTPASGEFLLTDKSPGSQNADQVVADRDGSFLLAWTEVSPQGDKTDVFVRRFNRDGTPRGARFQANPPSASSRSGGVLAIGPSGRFIVGWSADVYLPDDGSYANAEARYFTAAGVPIGNVFFLAEGATGIGDDNEYAYPTGLALGPDGSLTALSQIYMSPGDLGTVLLHRPANGAPGSLLQLNPMTNYFLAPGSWLALGRDGSLLAVWSQWEVVGERFAPNGKPLGESFLVSKRAPEEVQLYPVAAPVPGGKFLIVWTDTEGRDGSGWGLFGRTFAADGTPLSADVRINATADGHQYAPAIATAPKGPVVVAWNRLTGTLGNEKYDIFARVVIPASP